MLALWWGSIEAKSVLEFKEKGIFFIQKGYANTVRMPNLVQLN